MPGIVVKRQVCRRLATTALLEADFEQLIRQEAEILFPSYRLLDFRRTVLSEHGVAQPDFILVHTGYRDWWVVEVEMAHHSFIRHVLPQVRALATACYGPQEAELLAARGGLDARRIESMILGTPPRVLVIANEEVDNWRADLRALDCYVMVVEVYRSDRNMHALLVKDEIPTADDNLVSKCRVDEVLGPKFVRLESPGALEANSGEELEIEYRGRISRWRVLRVKDACWLQSAADTCFQGPRRLEITRDCEGRLMFRDERGEKGVLA